MGPSTAATRDLSSPVIAILSLLLLLHISHPCHATSFSSHPEEKRLQYYDSGLLAAFADVNADKRTDILLIDKGLKSFTIMHHEEHDDFDSSILSLWMRCYMRESIVSLVPGDFNGDTFIDIAVISRVPTDLGLYNIRVLIGDPKSKLNCSSLNETTPHTSSVEPLMLDYNGDMICDLLIVSQQQRIILQGSSRGDFYRFQFPTDEIVSIPQKHSNAFVDFNHDYVADIVMETSHSFEYWYAHIDGHYGEPDGENGKRKASKKVPRIRFIDGYEIVHTGISVFTDLDGDSFQDHLMPVNIRVKGELQAAILLLRESDYTWSLIASNFTRSNETDYLSFHEEKFAGSIIFPRAIRQGDVNGDGYPDLVCLMSKKSSSGRIVVLKNVPTSDGNRSFAYMSEVPRLNRETPLVAAFMDLTENGKLDIMYSSSQAPIGGPEILVMGSIKNVVAIDTYFLKIMVSSGHCPPKGCTQEGWAVMKKDVVDYGSNLPGPYVTYELQDANGMKKISGSGQMTATSHFALQTPYLVFGLGEYANYIDKILVTIPYLSTPHSHSLKRFREEEQIVPDAQIIIVPRPETEPRRWIMKMWISITGNQIKHTGFTLLGIFFILIIIILLLHKKEVMEDAEEKKQFKESYLDGK